MNKYRVTLPVKERAELERVVSVGKGAARKLTHARIRWLADTAAGAEHADEESVAAWRVGLCTVGRVRQRLVTQGLPAALNPRAQPPRPDKSKMKGDVEQELIRLACSDPPEGRCHWTLQLLADELVVLGLVEDISTETVRQALKKRHPTVARRDLVHPTASGCRLCLADGRCDPDLLAAVRSGLPGGLF